jgi:hypothetical protein
LWIIYACSRWSYDCYKIDKQINAEDNTDALLAEAEYIINHADEFVGMEDELLLAA